MKATARRSKANSKTSGSGRAARKLLSALGALLLLRRLHLRRRTTTRRAIPLRAETSATAVYDEYLKEELARQEARKASFEQRGLAVVTTAGTLVTLLFGLSAIATASSRTEPFGQAEKVLLAVAITLFVVSAALALWSNFPMKYRSADAPDMKERLRADDSPDGAAFAVADLHAEILETAQGKNTLKGRLVTCALAIEVAAVAFVSVAIIEVMHP
jgi:hypothetical protein